MKKSLTVFLALMIASGIATAYFVLVSTTAAERLIAQHDPFNLTRITQYALTSSPSIEQVPAFGNASAPLHIILYWNPADISATTLAPLITFLRATYVDTGQAALFQKRHYYLTDIQEHTTRFKYALALACSGMLEPEKYYSELISGEQMQQQCDLPDDQFLAQAAEIERLGMVGIQPRWYLVSPGFSPIIIDGIPTQAQMQHAIRSMQMLYGE